MGLASPSDLEARYHAGTVALSWTHPGDIDGQSICFDVYAGPDPRDLFAAPLATGITSVTAVVDVQTLTGEIHATVVARRGDQVSLPARAVTFAVPPEPVFAPPPVAAAGESQPRGLGFPFGVDAAGGIFALGGDALLRSKILQLLLTVPGERVNRPDYGTRLMDLVFDPSSDVLAATTEFLIMRALQKHFADEIQVDGVQIAVEDAALLVDISYVKRIDLQAERVRIGVPLPAGVLP